ncbi:cell division cycle and apoptosis regulator protein 1-like [Bombina bombina]|uniref:cell division cycle and apoptosis regulator protein 1-like n=1 Tax=Bombina bombina TaxID=8345 RepID=UPI00235ADCC5|nr:cell division cycle and apoptosis regulator protein 1-like [Bombina bombina]
MAQYGGQKNPPPWATQFTATAVSQPAAMGVQQPSLLGASPTIYTQQSALSAACLTSPSPANYQLTQTAALQQQAAAAAAAALQQQYSQPQQTIYSVQQSQLQQPQQTLITQTAVALPTSLALSTQQQTAQITVSYPSPRSGQQQTQPQKQRVFTGVVTKLHETFGFVDEDVFFQLTISVLALPASGFTFLYTGLLQTPVRIVPQPIRRIEPPSRFSGRNDRGESLSSRKDDRTRDRERRRSRERSPQRKWSRERSPRRERDRSPRRPRRVAPRYMVQFSKFSLDCPGCDMMELRRRYQNLYIPSDFFNAQFTWLEAFPISRPFQLGNYSNFHVMNKEVDPLEKITAVVDPPDADPSFCAKVMMLASPALEGLYHKSCALAEDPVDVREGFQHPTRLIKVAL